MVFKCQEDTYLKEFETVVVSCNKSQLETITDGKKTKLDGYDVELQDTIIFPEGGGQPSDYGYLNNKRVYHVKRKADKAIHFLTDPLDAGEIVHQTIDWERRFDHMQQHSGQHLITAVIDREFKYTTVSWWLGEEVSYIELATPAISVEEIQKAEKLINGAIRDARKVTVTVYKEDTPEEQLKEARSARGLPEDHKGDIRVINIEGIEGNMCCGTHVTNLSQLQVVKLLHYEKSKRKNQILLYFLVGNRVLKRLSACLEREQKLTAILNNGAASHVDLVDKLQKNVKVLSKNLQTVLKDLVVLEVSKLKSISPPPKYYCYHRKEAEPDFMNLFIKEFNSNSIFLFLSVGDDKGAGNIVLYGEEKTVADLGQQVCELLNGKGAGKNGRFQAKVNNMKNRQKAEDLIKAYFADAK